MKKKKAGWRRLAAGFLCWAVVLAGCGGGGGETQPESASPANEYQSLAGVYSSDLSAAGMNVVLYLQIEEDARFVLSRSTDFSDTSKGAGYLRKDAEGNDTFVYQIVRDAEVEEGTHVSRFEVTPEGGIQFLSLMWFGSTTPRLTAADGTETYPLFLPYDGTGETEAATAASSQEASTEAAESSSAAEESTARETEASRETDSGDSGSGGGSRQPSQTQVQTQPQTQPQTQAQTQPQTQAQTQPQTQAPTEAPTEAPAFQEGTYTGSYDKFVDAMQSDIHYDIRLRLSGGSYSYEVSISVSGNLTYSDTESYSGSYTVNGDSLSMTGVLSSGSARDGALTVTGMLSSFAGSNESVTLYR